MTGPKLGHLLMRDLNPWEGPALFAMTGDRNVMRYMGFKQHSTVDEATELLQVYRESPSRWQAVTLDGDPSDVLGVIGFEVQGHQATMSMMFRSDFKARGAGRQFALPFIHWVFTHPQVWRLWTYVHVDNMAGQHVTERLGAVCEGRARRFAFFPNVSDEPQDCYLYSVVRGS